MTRRILASVLGALAFAVPYLGSTDATDPRLRWSVLPVVVGAFFGIAAADVVAGWWRKIAQWLAK